MKKVFFIPLIFSLAIFYVLQSLYAQDIVNNDSIVVLSHKFKGDAIIGEIKNNGKEPVKLIEITASFYDKNDDFIGSKSTYTKLNPLPQGIKSPFTLFVDDDIARTFFNYELMITWTNANSSKGMKIIEKPSSDIVEVECGMKVKDTVILDKDLNCSGNDFHGLLVKDDNVVINLNGHMIRGPGKELMNYDGIFIENSLKNISISGPGKITDYRWGIMLFNNQNVTIQSINFEENEVGILISGNDIKIYDNTFENNENGVFHDIGHDNTIKNNKFHNSEQVAIALRNSINSTIENNSITSSKMAGIGLSEESTNNFILSNNLKNNKVDIDSSLSSEENNNQFSNNICEKSLPEELCD